MTKETAQELSRILGERPEQYGQLYEYTNRGVSRCFVALNITKAKKICSFISCVEIKERMSYKRILEIEEYLNSREYPGYFKVEQAENLLFYQYVRTLSNCFGYWNKSENYSILVGDGIRILKQVAGTVEDACVKGAYLNV